MRYPPVPVTRMALACLAIKTAFGPGSREDPASVFRFTSRRYTKIVTTLLPIKPVCRIERLSCCSGYGGHTCWWCFGGLFVFFFLIALSFSSHISENTPWRKRNLRAQSANVYARIPVYASMSGVVSHELTSQRPTSFVDEFGKSTVNGCDFVAFVRVVYFQILGSLFSLMFGTWTDTENIHLAFQYILSFLFLSI